MSGINTGILVNAKPLSTERIKELEKQVLEKQETFAYLDENSELCFATSTGVEGIKDLAWQNAYELSNNEGIFTKKVYAKTGLKTFEYKTTLTKSSIDDLWPDDQPAQIADLEGSGQEYYTMAPSVLSFRSTAPLDEFQGVQVNGQIVDPSSYELEEGSTIVKLSADYLKTLNTGTHEISVLSNSQIAIGDFTVKAPGLGANGFYYNQPYHFSTADHEFVWSDYGKTDGTYFFLIKEDNTWLCGVNGSMYDTYIDYSAETDRYSFEIMECLITGHFASDGMTFICDTFTVPHSFPMFEPAILEGIQFKLDKAYMVADEEYLYAFDSTTGSWSMGYLLDNAKKSYGPIKANINGVPVTAIGYLGGFITDAFYGATIIETPSFPDSISDLRGFTRCKSLITVNLPVNLQRLDNSAFYECTALETIELPESLKTIGAEAFKDCKKLNNIIFNGTVAQWHKVSKYTQASASYLNWNSGAPAAYVQCSDGQVTI